MYKALLISIFSLSYLLNFSQTTVLDTFLFDGLNRNYQLYIPNSYNGSEAVPLVLNIHGKGSNAAQQDLYGNLKPQADADNFLIVHPNSTVVSGTTLWNSSFLLPSDPNYVDDVGFLDALIDTMIARYNIDTSKIYSTGMSNGGFMSYTLACELGNRIKKIASVTGSMSPMLYNSCTPSREVPVLQIHGTTDPTVPYDGGSLGVGIEEVIDFWVQNNNCNATPTVFNIPDINTTDNSTVERYVYSNSTVDNSVVLFKVINGGHTWPNAIINIPSGNTNRDFDASTAVWAFFKGESNITNIENVAKSPSIDILFKTNEIEVLAPNETINTLRIVNLLGQELIHTSQQNIDISALPSTYYFIVIETEKGIYSKSFIK